MAETLTQKTARLKALREARDGTSEQIRAKQKARIAFANRVRAQAFDEFIGNAVRYINANPQAPIQDVTAILKTATKLGRRIK